MLGTAITFMISLPSISALKAISILTPLLTITSVLMSADSAEISDREFEELSAETYRKPLMRSDQSDD